MTIFYRNGYQESELLNYDTENIKANMALHLRTRPAAGADSPELIWANNFSQGSTIFQGAARFRLEDLRYLTSRLGFRQRDKFFLRFYVTADDVGDTYNPYSTAQKLNEAAKTNEIWGSLYTDAWLSNFGQQAVDLGYPLLQIIDGKPFYDFAAQEAFFANPLVQDSLASWHQQTVAIVNNSCEQGSSTFLVPGTPEFEEEFQRIISTLNNAEEGGSKLFTRSELYHAAGEYIFNPTWTDKITVGGSGRLFTPDTRGTIFADTTSKITNHEFGFYAGIEKRLYDDRLILSATARADKNQNFDWIATPAASRMPLSGSPRT